MLWLLLHPLVSVWCFLKAKQAGLRGWPWALLAMLTGPVSVPLFLNHRRMVYRKSFGHNTVKFRP